MARNKCLVCEAKFRYKESVNYHIKWHIIDYRERKRAPSQLLGSAADVYYLDFTDSESDSDNNYSNYYTSQQLAIPTQEAGLVGDGSLSYVNYTNANDESSAINYQYEDYQSTDQYLNVNFIDDDYYQGGSFYEANSYDEGTTGDECPVFEYSDDTYNESIEHSTDIKEEIDAGDTPNQDIQSAENKSLKSKSVSDDGQVKKKRSHKKKVVEGAVNEVPVYGCNQCEFITKVRKEYMEHFKSAHESRFKCQHCDYRSNIIAHFEEHKTTHSEDRPYACSLCPYRAKVKRWITKHCYNKHFDITNPANVSYKQRQHNYKYKNRGTNTYRYTCDLCNAYTGKCKQQVMYHKWAVHNITPPDSVIKSCSQCSFKTLYKENLLRHLQQHDPDAKQHTCDRCGYKSYQRSTLMAHIRTHTGEAPYMCDHCGACFKQRTQMVSHVRRHHKDMMLPDGAVRTDRAIPLARLDMMDRALSMTRADTELPGGSSTAQPASGMEELM